MRLNKFFVVVVLLLATISLFKGVQRFQSAGPELLRNNSFEKGFKGWTRHGVEGAINLATGVVTLVNHDNSRSVGIRQTRDLLPEQEYLMMSADISTKNVEPGTKPWHSALIYLVGRNVEGKFFWKTQTQLANISGSNNWKQYSDVFIVAENVSEVVVNAQLVRATGVMRVRNLSLLPATERVDFRVVAYGLLLIWCMVFLWIGIPVFQGAGLNLATGFLSLIVLAILVAVLTPNSVKQEFLDSAPMVYAKLSLTQFVDVQWIRELGWNKREYLDYALEIISHFTLFFVVTIAVRFTWPLRDSTSQLVYLLLFAAVTETLQFYAAGRKPSLDDWLVDVSGILLAFALLWFFNRSRNSVET